MSVWQREHRQEGKGLSTSVTATASDPNPIVMFIVSLLAAATMPDDRLALANRASTQDDLGASCGPIGSQVVPVGGKWDNKNRGNGGLCSERDPAKFQAPSGALHLLGKIFNWKKNSASTTALGVQLKGLAG